jgi:preprotein translocase subunit SecE
VEIIVAWFQRLKTFLIEVWAELQKTSWPARREVYGTTVVVIIATLICAAYLYVVDRALDTGIQYLFTSVGR